MTNNRDPKPTALPKAAWAFLVLMVSLGGFFPATGHATVTPAAGAMSQVSPGAPVRVYGNSVIPGGVRGSAELSSALGRDRVLRAHFANFDVANARVVQVQSARLVHVSYRMGNNIYWTKKKVRLAKGEKLLTDGQSFVRARCGNRIADLPQVVVSNMEPAPEILDTAQDMPHGALSLTNYSPDSVESVPAAFNVFAGNSAQVAAPVDASAASLQRASLEAGSLAGPAFGSLTTSPAGAVLPPGALGQVKALLPALAEAINNEVLAVLVTAPLAQLTASSPTIPLGDILPVPLSLSGPTTLAPSQDNVNPADTTLVAFPSAHTDAPAPPVVLLADENATELPEPGSLVLLALALLFMGLIRRRDHQ